MRSNEQDVMQDVEAHRENNSSVNSHKEPAVGDISPSVDVPEAANMPLVEKPKPKDIWDKADILGKLLASILIPIGLASAGFIVNSVLQDRAAKQKTAEIAITVLQSKDASIPALKKWAMGAFIQMLADANNPLSLEAQKELQTTALPSSADSSLPTACPIDVTTLSGKKLAEKFEGSIINDKTFDGLQQAIQNQLGPSLSDRQAQALASIAYNIGLPNLMKSSIIASLKAGDRQKAADGFMNWDKSGGSPLPGLHARRLCERDLFLSQ